MQTQKDSVRMGVYISKKLQDRVDHAIPKTDARSRSEFITDALELYLAWLDSYDYSKVLTPALESVIEYRGRSLQTGRRACHTHARHRGKPAV